MLRALATSLLVSGLVAAAAAQDHAQCPMNASHSHRTQVDHRHDEATGVAHEGIVHHFLLANDGGSIRLEVNDPSQVAERDRLREHVQMIARSFAAGDFSMPMFIHDQLPPGVRVMKKRKRAIHYAYAPSQNGGEVHISTRDAKAVDAIHEFLRFQIRDHGTNDPTE